MWLTARGLGEEDHPNCLAADAVNDSRTRPRLVENASLSPIDRETAQGTAIRSVAVRLLRQQWPYQSSLACATDRELSALCSGCAHLARPKDIACSRLRRLVRDDHGPIRVAGCAASCDDRFRCHQGIARWRPSRVPRNPIRRPAQGCPPLEVAA